MTNTEMRFLHSFEKLYPGILLRRYKRFLTDVRLTDGGTVTAFTPNSGRMKTCSEPGSPVMLSHDPKPGRKTEYNLEMVNTRGTWVGVNTGLANLLGARIIDAGLTGHQELEGFRVLRRESRWGNSRFDLQVVRGGKEGFVEIKNVTYRSGNLALFPDAVTSRGTKHLNTLIRAREEGYLAANLYVVQRSDCLEFAPAQEIDSEYARTFHDALRKGVIIIACSLHVRPEGISYRGMLPLKKI